MLVFAYCNEHLQFVKFSSESAKCVIVKKEVVPRRKTEVCFEAPIGEESIFFWNARLQSIGGAFSAGVLCFYCNVRVRFACLVTVMSFTVMHCRNACLVLLGRSSQISAISVIKAVVHFRCHIDCDL